MEEMNIEADSKTTEVAWSLFVIVRRSVAAVGIASVVAGVLRRNGTTRPTYGGWTTIDPSEFAPLSTEQGIAPIIPLPHPQPSETLSVSEEAVMAEDATA